MESNQSIIVLSLSIYDFSFIIQNFFHIHIHIFDFDKFNQQQQSDKTTSCYHSLVYPTTMPCNLSHSISKLRARHDGSKL